MSEPVVVFTGDNSVLLSQAVSERISEMLGGRDATGVVDEFSGDEYPLAEAMLAASAVSMFGERIVVCRNAGRADNDDIAALTEYLADPNPDTTLLVAWEAPMNPGVRKKPFAKKISDVIKAAGGVVIVTSAPSQAKAQQGWINERLSASTVRFTPGATAAITDHLGEDIGRVGAIIDVIESSFAAGTRIEADDITPLLTDAGGVPPWDLTDALAAGRIPDAVGVARRMMRGGGRHPLQLMATLQSHYESVLRLDGAGIRSEAQAADVLGIKPYPAKKILAVSQRLGHGGSVRAISLLATADVDLRGATAIDPQATIEVLVARLAALARR